MQLLLQLNDPVRDAEENRFGQNGLLAVGKHAEDEQAALALGKNAFTFRLQAFVIGGAIMGLAGAVQAHFIGFIAPENYVPMLTFQVWAMLIIGGSGNNRGAILGAILVWAVWAASAAAISARGRGAV